MSDVNDPKERAEKAPENSEKEPAGRKSFDPTIFLVGLLTLLVLSISYFFVFALPTMKRDQLGLEQAKYAEEKQLRESYLQCVDAAEEEYENYIRLNGSPVEKQPGAYSAPEYIWQTADRNRNAAIDECSRNYRH
ncbi:MAG: hypothetical protein EG828_01145 [Deltaproteobacteria bacterium]|nr:hypothetical protein [Deltaproteobacteria bacterium]